MYLLMDGWDSHFLPVHEDANDLTVGMRQSSESILFLFFIFVAIRAKESCSYE